MVCLRANKNLKGRRQSDGSVKSETTQQVKNQQIETKSLNYMHRRSDLPTLTNCCLRE